jgi:hypothetical protein
MEIYVEKIMEPVHLPFFSKIALIISAVLAITIIGLPIAALIVVISTVINMFKANKGAEVVKQKTEEVFKKFIGKPVKYLSVNVCGLGDRKVSGTAIAYDSGMIFIMDRGLAAKIPFDQIRNWKWSVAGYETTTLYGDVRQIDRYNVANRNANAQHEAYVNSGLFISVASLDYPEWQFMTIDEAVLKRWMEILKQASEGRI